jgi:hypothetical protein
MPFAREPHQSRVPSLQVTPTSVTASSLMPRSKSSEATTGVFELSSELQHCEVSPAAQLKGGD